MLKLFEHMFGKRQTKLQEIKAIEKEFNCFQDYCLGSGFTPEELNEIYKPLIQVLNKSKLNRFIKFITSLLFIFVLINLYFDLISWHFSALGRIFLVKLLPFWNWEKLNTEKCLISNYLIKKTEILQQNQFDCNLCEAIDTISIENNIDPYELNDLYLDLNIPVIIPDGLRNYPDKNITESILNDHKLSESFPCEISSNFITKQSENIQNIIIKSFKLKKWYSHFQNCDFTAVKQFRLIAPRPYFLRPEILPIQYNWLLISSKYKAPKFKKINLIEKITIFGQIEGSNAVRLTPRLNCQNECQILEVMLQKGEVLIFTSLWDLEYKPNYSTDNIAVILETH